MVLLHHLVLLLLLRRSVAVLRWAASFCDAKSFEVVRYRPMPRTGLYHEPFPYETIPNLASMTVHELLTSNQSRVASCDELADAATLDLRVLRKDPSNVLYRAVLPDHCAASSFPPWLQCSNRPKYLSLVWAQSAEYALACSAICVVESLHAVVAAAVTEEVAATVPPH